MIGGPDAELGEPSIATFGADRIAIASLANITASSDPLGGLVPSIPMQGPPSTPCQGFAVCLFTSRDGGATWRNTSLPTARQYYDPDIVFTEQGRLIIATLAYGSGSSTRIDVTSTLDDGSTWSPTVTASNSDRVDRPWLRLGRDGLVLLYVAEGGREVRGAVSRDDGATWTAAGSMPCRWPSPPIPLPGGDWIFLCTSTQDGPWMTRAIRWDPASGTFEPKGGFPWSRWFPILVPGAGQGLVALTSHDENGEASITMRRSEDVGVSWAAPLDLRKASAELQALQYSCLMGAQTQADGIVRAIVSGIGERSQQAQLCLPRETRKSIWALDVDPATGALVAARPLGSPDEPPPIPSSETTPINDDFHSVQQGAMAWSHDGVVAWTRWT